MIQVIFNFNQEGFSQKGSNFVTVIIYLIRSQEVYLKHRISPATSDLAFAVCRNGLQSLISQL